MNLPGAAALPVFLACGDPFTASLSYQPGQHVPAEAPIFQLGPRPAHTVIMAALTTPAPPYFRGRDPSRSCAPQRHRIEADIRKWINDWNKNPRPFIWTKTADEILGTLAAYCQRINDSGH